MGGKATVTHATGADPQSLIGFQNAVLEGQNKNIQGLISNTPYLYQKPQLSYLDNLMNMYAQTSEQKNRDFERKFNPGAEDSRLAIDKYYGELAKGSDALLNRVADISAKRGLEGAFQSGLKVGDGQTLGRGAVGTEMSTRMLDYANQKQQQLENFASRPRAVASLDAVSAGNLENNRQGQNQAATNSMIGNIYNANQDVNRNMAAFGQQGIGYYGQIAQNQAQAANYSNALSRQRKQQAWGSLARSIPVVGGMAGGFADGMTA